MKIYTERIVRIELIKEYCKKNNLSKIAFCNRCGIALQSLQKINRKNFKYQTETINKIAQAMGVEVWDLYVNE